MNQERKPVLLRDCVEMAVGWGDPVTARGLQKMWGGDLRRIEEQLEEMKEQGKVEARLSCDDPRQAVVCYQDAWIPWLRRQIRKDMGLKAHKVNRRVRRGHA